jgi:hypothetical protein
MMWLYREDAPLEPEDRGPGVGRVLYWLASTNRRRDPGVCDRRFVYQLGARSSDPAHHGFHSRSGGVADRNNRDFFGRARNFCCVCWLVIGLLLCEAEIYGTAFPGESSLHLTGHQLVVVSLLPSD